MSPTNALPGLQDLTTPALLLDLDRVERNCARMRARATILGVALRPHLKTAKSSEIGRLASGGVLGPITASTLAEVEYFAAHGYRDITYAVGIAPQKLYALAAIQERFGASVSLIVDELYTVREIATIAEALQQSFRVFVEIDSGGGRGGVVPEDPELLDITAAIVESPRLGLAGVLTHAGHSYGAADRKEMVAIAEAEREAATRAAARLRSAGFTVPFVSVGSTPTILSAESLEGVTDVRPGVYMLFDLDQAALGVCSLDDIAASVLTTVIGHNPRSQRILIDAGGLALSKDLSAFKRDPHVGYGLVCPPNGVGPISGLRVAEVYQEHGMIAVENGFEFATERYPVGTQLRILPNHVCMTAAAFDRYHLVRGDSQRIIGTWDKIGGWTAGREARA
jgi:D-serine deaminase-like pyridoxal phosphate-dependent protein